MTLTDVEEHFGNLRQACLQLGIRPQNANQWRKRGWIPLLQQYRIAELTDGKLMPQEEDPKMDKHK